MKITFVILAAMCATASATSKEKLISVFIDAHADEAYIERKSGSEPETYIFMQGQALGGTTDDESLDSKTFTEIIEPLRKELKVKNYYSSEKPKDADLLLVVHWGATDALTDLIEDLDLLNTVGFENDLADAFTLSDISDPTSMEAAAIENELTLRTYAIYDWDEGIGGQNEHKNYSMLGFKKALTDRKHSLVDQYRIAGQSMLERYFIVLIAYDWQLMQTTGEKMALWETRFSVQADGTNFEDSLPALARAANEYFGVDLEKMAIPKTYLGKGDINVGELEVIETATEAKKLKD